MVTCQTVSGASSEAHYVTISHLKISRVQPIADLGIRICTQADRHRLPPATTLLVVIWNPKPVKTVSLNAARF